MEWGNGWLIVGSANSASFILISFNLWFK